MRHPVLIIMIESDLVLEIIQSCLVHIVIRLSLTYAIKFGSRKIFFKKHSSILKFAQAVHWGPRCSSIQSKPSWGVPSKLHVYPMHAWLVQCWWEQCWKPHRMSIETTDLFPAHHPVHVCGNTMGCLLRFSCSWALRVSWKQPVLFPSCMASRKQFSWKHPRISTR